MSYCMMQLIVAGKIHRLQQVAYNLNTKMNIVQSITQIRNNSLQCTFSWQTNSSWIVAPMGNAI